MDKELLRKVKKYILEEPLRLRMADWVQQGKPGELLDPYYPKKGKYASCGTAACIGGWAKILSGHKSFNEGPSPETLLGLSYTQAENLFYRSRWPDKFRLPYKDDGSKKSAKIAADRIDYFIRTKGK